MNPDTGCLYIVATPIGNLGDMTYRAVKVLQEVDLILAEDTRNAGVLMRHYAIHQPLRALHEHNENQLSADIIKQLAQGKNIALISDAGTPLVSDPGFRLVRAAQAADIQPVTVPGACAAIAALSIAGLPTDRFSFEGFLPAKQAAREQNLKQLVSEPRTLVFYEAKHRILPFLKSMQSVFGDSRKVVVARELTKKFESVYQGTFDAVIERIEVDDKAQKGEFVVMLSGAQPGGDSVDLDQFLLPLLSELGVSKASKIAARISGESKNQCYQRALELHKLKQ